MILIFLGDLIEFVCYIVYARVRSFMPLPSNSLWWGKGVENNFFIIQATKKNGGGIWIKNIKKEEEEEIARDLTLLYWVLIWLRSAILSL